MSQRAYYPFTRRHSFLNLTDRESMLQHGLTKEDVWSALNTPKLVDGANKPLKVGGSKVQHGGFIRLIAYPD